MGGVIDTMGGVIDTMGGVIVLSRQRVVTRR